MFAGLYTLLDRPGIRRQRSATTSRDRAAIDLHAQSAALAGGQRGAPGSCVRYGWATKNVAAGGAAASACGLSKCPACADADACSWQRTVRWRSPSGRSAGRRSRCARRRGERDRPSRCCVSAVIMIDRRLPTTRAVRRPSDKCSDRRSVDEIGRPRYSTSVNGTLETCRMTRRMSANRGRPEVSGARST
jgi:hypothetical protein